MQACPDRVLAVSLRRLLPEAEIVGAEDIYVRACSADSRRVAPGQLYAALAGKNADGHDYIPEALAQGAAAILTERPLPGLPCPACLVSNSRDAYARICQALADNPSHRLKVIGITGTNGKTTTSCLVASILATAGHRVGILGTLGYFDGLDAADSTHTTPPADQLADWLARMVQNGCSHAVMEVSSHALDQSRVAGVRMDAACVTNVRRDHLDYHGTHRDYRLAKSRLFDHLAAEGFVVINADDPTAAGYLHLLDGPVLTVAMRSAAEITGRLLERHPSEQTFLLSAGSQTAAVRTRMIGDHHIYNCLVAAAVGLAYGIDLMTVVRGLEGVEHIPGRLERIECGQPFGVFVDFAHTPDALEGSLRTLRDVTGGRLICVFGAGGDRDRQKRPMMGRAVEQNCDRALVTSDNPRTEDPQRIIDDVLAGFYRPSQVEVIADRAEAICAALAEARPGDCVLIAGKGHETYQVIGRRRFPFDDRQVARLWLYQSQGAESVS